MGSNRLIEFLCSAEDCGQPVRFALNEVENKPSLQCPACGRSYILPPPVLQRLRDLKELVRAIQKARPILGDSNVVIEVSGHKVAIPYYLLLSRLTTELALNIDGNGYTFRFLVDPLVKEEER